MSSVTLAFLDSPMGIAVLFIAVLILFGPKKVPEIAGQLGRALRDFRRATGEFSRTMNMDDHDTPYTPSHYDSYGNSYHNESDTSSHSSVTEDDMHVGIEVAPSSSLEPQRGDFAAAAFADTVADYGVSPTPPPAAETSPVYGVMAEAQEIAARPAEGAVPRS